MLAFKEPAQPSPSLVNLNSRFDQLPLQHRNGNQEIVAPGSLISGKDRVGGVGDTENACPLLLLVEVAIENLNPPTQVCDESVQFHSGAGIVQ
jgi:hypothetical protein